MTCQLCLVIVLKLDASFLVGSSQFEYAKVATASTLEVEEMVKEAACSWTYKNMETGT